jgi:hypothetical protein
MQPQGHLQWRVVHAQLVQNERLTSLRVPNTGGSLRAAGSISGTSERSRRKPSTLVHLVVSDPRLATWLK